MCHGCLHDPLLQNKIHERLGAKKKKRAFKRSFLITGASLLPGRPVEGRKGYVLIVQNASSYRRVNVRSCAIRITE